jgi:hypothetical protein
MERVQIPKFYQVHHGKKDYQKNNVRMLPIISLCIEQDLS